MAHIPFGYKIVDGCAVIDETAVSQLKGIYEGYFAGKSLVVAAKDVGLECTHAVVARMLSNRKYLGTDYYPQIIEEELIDRFLEERNKRAGKLGRLDRIKVKEVPKIPTEFIFKPARERFADPFRQAEYIYSLIESEG